MLTTIILIIAVILAAVNLILLWQVYRKMKQNMDKKLETVEPYIMTRLTVFGINMVFLCLVGIGKALMQLFFHA